MHNRLKTFFVCFFLSSPLYAEDKSDLIFGTVVDLLRNETQNTYSMRGAGFWHSANTLQACIDHLLLTGQKDSKDLLPLSLEVFKSWNSSANWKDWTYWVDDYGWWGLVFLKIYQHLDLLTDNADDAQKKEFLDLAVKCWERLHAEWNRDGEGGIRNTPLDNNKLESRKNSITNLLFLVLSAQLHLTLYDPLERSSYKDAAEAEYLWLRTGRVEGASGNQTNWTFFNPFDLVLETPNGGNFVSHHIDWFWSGDQGIFLEALRNLGALNEGPRKQSFEEKAAHFVEAIFVMSEAIILFDPEGVVHESNFTDNFSYGVDYATGKGVLLSALGYYNRSLKLKKYSEILQHNADAFLSKVEIGKPYPFNWNPNYAHYEVLSSLPSSLEQMTLLTAGLNALNAAK